VQTDEADLTTLGLLMSGQGEFQGDRRRPGHAA